MKENRKKVLEVRDLRQHFHVGVGKNKLTVKAVDGISFDIYEGEVFGLVGESGCGKTTTGRTIIKLYRPTDGTVKFNGKTIGAGYSGNLRRIRLAKEAAKKAIIEADDFKRQSTEIKDKYNNLISEQKVLLQNANQDYKERVKEINNYNNVIKVEIDAIKNRYNLKISELEHARTLKIDEINQSPKDIVDHDYKIFQEAAKTRYLQRKSYLADALISQEEKKEQEQAFKDQYYDELRNIDKNYLKHLDRHNSENFVKKATALYKKRLRKAKDETEIANLEQALKDLDNYEVKPSTELTQEQKRQKINNLNSETNKEIKKLEKESELEVQKLEKTFKTKDFFVPQLEEAKNNYLTLKEEINNKIKDLKATKAQELAALKQARKDNPEAFKVDKDSQKEAKEKKKRIIKEEKKAIKRLKSLNKITETPEEKLIKEENIKIIKQNYAKKRSELEALINELETKVSANPNDEALAAELNDVKLQLDNLNIEEGREVHKEKISNSYAGVMSQLQMIFQDPVSSLNPRKTVREIISEGLIIQGIKDEDYIDEKVAESLNLVGLSPEHSNRYPHEFSGGQRQRIGIARALIVNPSFIIADEPISALDVSIQAQIINLLKDLKDQLGLTILFIAHDLSVVKYFSDRIAVMYFGKIVEQATSEELFKNPIHPYTKSLLSAIPNPDPDSEKVRTRTTYDPSIHDYSEDKPELVEIRPGHFVSANKKEAAEYKKQLKGVR